MGFTGGGVGIGYVPALTEEMEQILEDDSKVQACRGSYGVCLANRNGGPHSYMARRVSYVPHELVAGRKARRNREWPRSPLGDGMIFE